MSREAYLRPEAREDLRDAATWYEGRDEGLGSDFIDEFLACISRIEEYPESYQLVDEGIRSAVLHRFPYAIFYSVEPSHIEVLSVLRCSRDPEVWRSRA